MEDKLNAIFPDKYSPPHVVPVSEEMDDEVPRIIFSSKNGFSQILISQKSITLNVMYSPDWQTEMTPGREYVRERIPVLYDIAFILPDMDLFYAGLVAIVNIPTARDDDDIVKYVHEKLFRIGFHKDVHDVQCRITEVIDGMYYSNNTIRNYRSWAREEIIGGIPRMKRSDAKECGVQIIGDFNDRYAFNELASYRTEKSGADQLALKAFSEIDRIISLL